MEKIDWKRKLSSRKFWVAVCSFVTNLIIAFGGSQNAAVQVTAVIMSGASVLAYIVAEGLVDAKQKKPDEEPKEPEASTTTYAMGFSMDEDDEYEP